MSAVEAAATVEDAGLVPLKTLTSLNKEVRPFFLSDNSIWSLPSVFPWRLQHLEVLKAI